MGLCPRPAPRHSGTMATTLIPPTPTREEYLDSAGRPLEDIFARGAPLPLFKHWLSEAGETEPNDPNAVALATVDAQGHPDVRMVLLKGVSEAGLVFYSHLDGAKGVQIAANPHAALCFHWKSSRRQVRVRGPVERIPDAEADAYFARRARLSQVGAHASRQSRPLESREHLREEVARLDAEFGSDVPRPPDWTGFRVVPEVWEFWRDRPFRLHDRLVFTQEGDGWTKGRLYP